LFKAGRRIYQLVAKEDRPSGVSQSRVFQILKEADLKPHKIEYWCGKSPDPEFESKMVNIIGLYLNPPQNALVLCVEENADTSAGQDSAIVALQSRNGTVSLIAALAAIPAKSSPTP
jgi:putative transposase